MYVGPGSVLVTWTINGMPPAAGCAAVGASSVQLQVLFGNPETVPCTDGMAMESNLPAGTYNITGALLDATGTVLMRYTSPTTVQSGQMVDTVLAFGPSGALEVHWTLGGMTATTDVCSASMVAGVQLDVGIGNPITVNVAGPDNWTCSAGSHTYAGLQPGPLTVAATVIDAMHGLGRSGSGTGMVSAGSTAVVTVDLPVM